MEPPKPKNPLINALIQHAIRAEDQFWGALQADLSPTGRATQPFNPEPHNLPRPKGHTLVLTTGPLNVGLRWTNVAVLKSARFDMLVEIEYCGDAPYCPVRFIPFYTPRP